MSNLSKILKLAREEKKLILRKVASELDIDQSLISKFEKGERKPTKEQLIKLSDFYNLPKQDLLIEWYSDKIIYELKDIDYANDILIVAEEKIKYQKANQNAV
ncbi:MAG: helix-turn-helix transcriptional regulator [Chitinophagales bacterium]|nr:helix-turn-helix transcriptional regulator [Chitinophagales bacterium]